MTSRERVRAALAHREPDRVPFDLGGSCVTGIHARAYARLREALGLPAGEPRVGDIAQQLADVEPDVIEALGCDVRGVSPGGVSTYHREIRDGGECRTFVTLVPPDKHRLAIRLARCCTEGPRATNEGGGP